MDRIIEIGYRNLHPRYGWFEVVKKVDNSHFVVRFENTNFQYTFSKYHIFNNHVSDKRNKFFHQVGEEYEHNIYGKYTIIEILKGKKAVIEFEKTKYRCTSTLNNIIKRRVKDATHPIMFGVGYVGRQRKKGERLTKSYSYTCWRNMLKRCYDAKTFINHHTYKDCEVCDEWHCFTTFEVWFKEKYMEGWCLDKDILIKGNKVYSPETCCFVPFEINNLFTKRQNFRGITPIGVDYHPPQRRFKACYTANISKSDGKGYIGCFATEIEAFNAYKTEKERYIKEVADKYKDELEPRVYEALYNYQVEITD